MLLSDLATNCSSMDLECLLTLNLPEELPFDPSTYPFPIKLIQNKHPLGFGANHNRAFERSNGNYFCIVNPDIRLPSNPFPPLLDCLQDSAVGLAAPMVLDPIGRVEDSARYIPSPLKILCKAFGYYRGNDYEIRGTPIHPEWVGGMFMLMPRERFAELHGFDERYFLYYEDVDLCARLRLNGGDIMLNPLARVTHQARRSSHHSFKYMRWHLGSMVRFFLSPPYWQWNLKRWQAVVTLASKGGRGRP